MNPRDTANVTRRRMVCIRSRDHPTRGVSRSPARKASVGVKYLEEFANQSTFQGYAVHIFGALVF